MRYLPDWYIDIHIDKLMIIILVEREKQVYSVEQVWIHGDELRGSILKIFNS